MTVAAGTVALNILLRAFVDGLIDKDEKVISSKINIPNSKLQKPYPF